MRLFSALFITIALATPVLLSQSRPPASRTDQETLAVIDGDRRITRREVDGLIGEKLTKLQRQIYELRRQTLNSEINRLVLEDEARRRGLTVEALKRELVPAAYDVPAEKIDSVLREYGEAVSNLDQQELRERIRLDLETNGRISRYAEAVENLKKNRRIEILIEEPEPFRIEIDQTGPRRGPARAPVTIVEFSDFQCPYCKKATQITARLIQMYGDRIAVVYKHSPSPSHPQAFAAARAAVCAAEQNRFWEYHDSLFAADDLSDRSLLGLAASAGLEGEAFSRCLASPRSTEAVERDLRLASRIGVRGTPHFVINGQSLAGAREIEAFTRIIDREIAGR
ncbi:MAG: thioredoxin domain-containing protein [Blastocatellales bacterium]